MPITLVTGLPGHGKTLYTLARWKAEAEKEQRPVFHNSIKGLQIVGWQTWQVDKWQDLPAGSLFVIDEAQFAFPVTGRGQTPEWVQKLATHRHLGLDLVVITQNPMLLDSFVRKLVDRHFHVVRKFGTHFATIYEFPNGVRENVATKRNDGIRHEWRYPKEVFGWYQSAELHTVKRRVPLRVWFLFILPLIFGVLVYFIYQRLNPQGERMQKLAGRDGDSASAQDGKSGSGSNAPGRGTGPMTVEEYAKAYSPRVAGLAHTAPIYDEVTKPANAPYPAACVQMRGECRCYTQQATRLVVRADVCAQIVAGGFFMAWDKPVAQAVPIQAPASVPVGQRAEPGLYAAAVGIQGLKPAPTVPPVLIPPDEGAPPRVRNRPPG